MEVDASIGFAETEEDATPCSEEVDTSVGFAETEEDATLTLEEDETLGATPD